jgi:hypothetical protein
MKTVVGKIVGTPVPGSWAQVVAFKPEAQTAAVRKIPLFVTLDFQGPADFEAVSLGKEVLSTLEEDFFKIDKETPFFALRRAVTASFKHLENVGFKDLPSEEGSNEESSSDQEFELEFNLVAASISKDILYLAQLGEGQVWLWRQGALGKVLVEPTSKVRLASGPVRPGDIAILGTPQFFKLVSLGELRAALAGGEVEEVIDGLAPKIHALEGSSTAAALFINLEEEAEGDGFRFQSQGPLVSKLPGIQNETEPQARRPIYLRYPRIRIKKGSNLLLAAIVLITLLFLSVIKGVGRQNFSTRYGRLETLLGRAEEKYKTAASLSDLNPTVSREFLREAKELLDEAEGLRIKSAKLNELSERVARELAEVSKVFKVENLEVFFNLNSVSKEAKGQIMTAWELGLLIVDSQGKGIYWTDLMARTGQVIASGEDLAGAKFIAESFVFTSQGIFQVDIEGKRIKKVIEPGDWEGVLGMSTYGGNIYLLDSAQNQIVKYIALESGFSAPRNYLVATETPDFSNAQDLAIDGWVYVLKQDGTILKYLQGAQEFFVVTGLDPVFSDPVTIYTEPEADHLYILDQKGSRIVVLTKTGDYHSQYVIPDLTGATDLVVVEKERQIYVLKGDKIYRIELKS